MTQPEPDATAALEAPVACPCSQTFSWGQGLHQLAHRAVAGKPTPTRVDTFTEVGLDAGAQVIQVFDSWAGHLEPAEFEEWAMPYQKQVVSYIKENRPDVPVIIYMAPDTHSKNGQFLTRLAGSGADVVSVDHTIELGEAKAILAEAGYPTIGLQGNLDPAILRDGTPDEIKAAADKILAAAGDTGHVMNLGHGIEATTPEPNAALFVNHVHEYKHA